MGIELRLMTASEYETWARNVVASYARERADSGAAADEANEGQARREFEQLLPDGLGTAGHLIFRLVVDGRPVGSLWMAVPCPSGNPTMAWGYNIEVDEAFRGRGYAREAILLAEALARSRGMRSIGLNVHGGNTVARSLYDSLGYEVMAQQMKKTL
jgi:ribosomal protein S18 acetylase RimI-like enzyme